MRILLIAVGRGMPGWVEAGVEDYASRLQAAPSFELIEVAAARRGRKPDPRRSRREEGESLLAAVPAGARIIALDERGRQSGSLELAGRMGRWMQEGRDVALLVGGADGLSAACLQAAESRWSLSRLTLPHMLVRVVVAEQIYRAWSILQRHPYHR